MRISFARWGFGVEVGGFTLELYLGDVYIKVPSVGELAWNQTGFYVDRVRRPSGSPKDQPEIA